MIKRNLFEIKIRGFYYLLIFQIIQMQNPVKKAICISGECLCGAYASKSERVEIAYNFPHVEEELKRLEAVAADHGHMWKWGSGSKDWYKLHPPGQQSMNFQPMCVGCANRN